MLAGAVAEIYDWKPSVTNMLRPECLLEGGSMGTRGPVMLGAWRREDAPASRATAAPTAVLEIHVRHDVRLNVFCISCEDASLHSQ